MEKRCYGCMEPNTQPVCAHCGFPEGTRNPFPCLPAGLVLHGRYLLGRVLGRGGFGITYLGWDQTLNRRVAVKEFFPANIVQRDRDSNQVFCTQNAEAFRELREKFLDRDARVPAGLEKIPQIAQVHDFFEEHDTAYIVMEYVDGVSLDVYIREQTLSLEQVLELLEPVMEALEQLHQAGFVHRDIAPDNIRIQPDGKAKLLDFGTVRARVSQGKSSALAVFKPGFSPPEQYLRQEKSGPWTDVYALGATIWYCLTREDPPQSPELMYGGEGLDWSGLSGLSKTQREALQKATALHTEDRFQTLAQFREALRPGKKAKPGKQKKPPRSSGARLKAGILTAAVLALAALLAVLWLLPKPVDLSGIPAMRRDFLVEGRATGEDSFYGVVEHRSQIHSIIFRNYTSGAPKVGSMDLSQQGDRSVLAWAEETDGMYRVYIAGEGGVRAPQDAAYLFSGCENMQTLNFYSYFYTGQTTDMTGMFADCGKLSYLSLSNEEHTFDTGCVTSMQGMFENCAELESITAGGLDTSAVTDMSQMFYNCRALRSFQWPDMDTGNVTDFSRMFYGCESMYTLDLSKLNTEQAQSMAQMFWGCTKLYSLDLTGFRTARVEDMEAMFYSCTELSKVDVSGFDTSHVTNMTGMFQNCPKLPDQDFSKWRVGQVRAYEQFLDEGRTINGRPWEQFFGPEGK